MQTTKPPPDQIALTLLDCLLSSSVISTEGEPATVVDVVDRLARFNFDEFRLVAEALKDVAQAIRERGHP